MCVANGSTERFEAGMKRVTLAMDRFLKAAKQSGMFKTRKERKQDRNRRRKGMR